MNHAKQRRQTNFNTPGATVVEVHRAKVGTGKGDVKPQRLPDGQAKPVGEAVASDAEGRGGIPCGRGASGGLGGGGASVARGAGQGAGGATKATAVGAAPFRRYTKLLKKSLVIDSMTPANMEELFALAGSLGITSTTMSRQRGILTDWLKAKAAQARCEALETELNYAQRAIEDRQEQEEVGVVSEDEGRTLRELLDKARDLRSEHERMKPTADRVDELEKAAPELFI